MPSFFMMKKLEKKALLSQKKELKRLASSSVIPSEQIWAEKGE